MPPKRQCILVVDDEPKIREILKDILEHKGYNVLLAEDGPAALEIVRTESVDLALLDLMMPGISGMEVLERLMKKTPGLPVIMVTAHGDIPLAVQATQLGAVDFIEKPVEMYDLLARIERQVRILGEQQRSSMAVEQSLERYGFIGISEIMQPIFKLIDQSAKTDIRIHISGETGTGKELIANAIHRLGRRSSRSFIKVNCAAIPEELIESELFGHQKGSFTGAYSDRTGKFEQAHKGTLFLDEVADMSFMTQAKVLRVLEGGELQPVGTSTVKEVDVRVISASNKNLEQLVAEGAFREDLYYRLNVMKIHLPPLSKRKEDIPHLVDYYLSRYAEDYNKIKMKISRHATELLINKPWSGNIRELRNFVEKLVVLTDSKCIETHHIKRLEGTVKLEREFESDLPLQDARDDFEQEYIKNKLIVNKWNITQVAKILNINRTTLYRKMQQFGLEEFK
ncbi:sigma-54-dependent Fis family transcriptional regulator [bacterium]|nr:sigma-54-dependent Fis family transcriptional regulator [bacterium]